MAEKIYRVNMSTLTATVEPVPDNWMGLGGRGLTSTVVAEEVEPTCHPLGGKNKLVIAPGLLSGTVAANSGRLSIGAKSPLTGTIKEANAGGTAAQMLARLGCKALIIEGMPEGDGWYTLYMDKHGITIAEEKELIGKGNFAVVATIEGRTSEKHGLITIGPAGEMKMLAANISIKDPDSHLRSNGRGGLGAVMGSKRVKCIVISPTDDKVEIANPEKFREANRAFTRALVDNPISQALGTYGTNVLVNIINEAGGLPTRAFSAGQFEGAAKISGEAVVENIEKRDGVGQIHHACHPGCIMQCSSIYPHEDGSPFVSVIEYETAWSLGANCGIDDIEYIAQATWECNDLGLDTIEAGNAIAMAMEGGYIEFGDTEGAIKTFDEIRKGTPIGRILAQGTEATAKAFGVHRVPTVKGQAMPAYEPRAIKGIGVTYATTAMGADHTSGYTIAPEIAGVGGKVDPLTDEGKAELSLTFQAATAFIDSTGYCLFIAFPILDIPEGWEGMAESVAGVTGMDITGADVIEIGKEVLKMERLFNEAAGFTNKDDRLPEFMKYEPLPPHNVTWTMADEALDKVYAWVHEDE